MSNVIQAVMSQLTSASTLGKVELWDYVSYLTVMPMLLIAAVPTITPATSSLCTMPALILI